MQIVVCEIMHLYNLGIYITYKTWADCMCVYLYCFHIDEKSIRDARTPQPGEIVFNTMT